MKLKFLCKVGLHRYKREFIAFSDQPFLDDRPENDLCGVEGMHVNVCSSCGKEKDFHFGGNLFERSMHKFIDHMLRR